MSRRWINDHLMTFPFWLADVAPLSTLSLPVLNPLVGFSSITAPEMQIEHEEFHEGNWMYQRKVVKNASASNITLSRGVTVYDNDFGSWARAAVTGDVSDLSSPIPFLSVGGPTYRRQLMLVHFFTRTIPTSGDIARAGLLGVGVGVSDLVAGLAVGALTGLAATGLAAAGIGAFEFAARIPARAYMLHGCIPARYKVASDYDASSNEVSIAELELAMEQFEEVTLL